MIIFATRFAKRDAAMLLLLIIYAFLIAAAIFTALRHAAADAATLIGCCHCFIAAMAFFDADTP